MTNWYKDILLGIAIGDALGVPVEFENRQELEKNPVVGMREYGTHYQPKGTWSDDTSLALCLAESLCNGYDLSDIGNNFVKWYNDGYWTPHGKVFDVGFTTARAISYFQSGCKPELAGMDREKDNGNGSLMRILPLVPYILNMGVEERYKIIREVSSLTHRHPRSILACIVLCEFAIQYINQQSCEKAYRTVQQALSRFLKREMFLEEEVPFKRFVELSYEEFKGLESRDIRSTGYVIDTLEASLWSVFNTSNFKDAVLKAVNLGHDTDTVGAITGGLAGVIHGYDSIPSEWINVLVRKDDIIELADRLDATKG